MSCQDCGAHARGDLCVDCQLDRAVANIDAATTEHECPDCGGETSGKGVTCHLCRDNHVEAQA